MALHEETLDLFEGTEFRSISPLRTQLLKWVGNKQRFAHVIASYFPNDIRTYVEPFLGSGAVLATLRPPKAVAGDILQPLMEIWKTLSSSPETLVDWYRRRHEVYHSLPRPGGYEEIKASYNSNPNGADLLFISRSCYGGVVRFRKIDGHISTPCGIHNPILPSSFAARVRKWYRRISDVHFVCQDFEETMAKTKEGDLVYCDPPYRHSQPILYQGQDFSLKRLMKRIAECKVRGVRVALSIDGTKKSGNVACDIEIPDGLFERTVFVDCGRSMLRRFQREGDTLEDEVVHDRLLMTY